MNLINDAEITNALSKLDAAEIAGANVKLPPDAKAREAYLKFKFLDNINRSTQVAGTQEQKFYSKYRYFRQFVSRMVELNGPDEGLEQQAFKLLESFGAENEVDWGLVEQIEKELGA